MNRLESDSTNKRYEKHVKMFVSYSFIIGNYKGRVSGNNIYIYIYINATKHEMLPANMPGTKFLFHCTIRIKK